MLRFERTGFALALLALGACAAEARPARQPHFAAMQPAERPHLVITEGEGGFVIRCETRGNPSGVPLPRGAIPLGASVRIDRAALQNSNMKDIADEKTR